jgi:4-amino-4-deoxy-L-arabinose transferase-like glycosyltransferase
MRNKKLQIGIILLIILAIASFFRLWQLNNIPPGLYPDVAINGNDALDSLRTGNFKVFYPENNGREGLFMWLIALSFSLFGASVWSMKIVAAAVGILTVLGLYLLTRQLFLIEDFNSPKASKVEIVALFSSFFLATSFWHTNFSRIGFRAILLPFVLVFAFYFLFRGYRQKKILDFMISGVFLGLGFYTYTPYRLAVLLLFVIFFCWFWIFRSEKETKKFILLTALFLLFAFIVALPLGIYFLQNPKDFLGRAAGVSVFAQTNPINALGESFVKHLGMFNFYGDPNWRHNFSGAPMLFWPIGILFLIGLIFSIKEIINFRKHKNWSLVIGHWSLVIWFFVMLLPGILTYEGLPHSLRVIGVIPVVYIFAGLGGWQVFDVISRNTKRRKIVFAAVFLFLATTGFSEFNKYFFIWAQKPEVKGAFTKNYAEIGNYLNSLPPETQKYVIVNEAGAPVPWPEGLPVPAQTIIFIENTKYGSPQSEYLLPESLNQIIIDKKPTVIAPMQYNQDLFYELFSRFPEGEIKEENGIWIYLINF